MAQNAKISYGCKTAASVQDMDGVLFWVAATRSGSFSVHKMENLKSQQISTPAIDRLLQGADYTTVYSWNAIRNGHRFYGITFKNSNLTLVYDDTTNLWAQWSSSTGGSYLAVVASTISPTNQVSLLQDEADGNIYKLNSTKYDYEGAAIPVDIYTPNFDGKQSKGKTVNKLYLLADQTPGSVVQVRYSDDDYRTWSNFIEVDLSQVSPLIENMGTFVKRAHHIRHTCNTPLRIKALEAHMLLGVL